MSERSPHVVPGLEDEATDAPPDGAAAGARRGSRLGRLGGLGRSSALPVALVTAAFVVVALVVGVVVFDRSGTSGVRGATSARAAAAGFVTAIDAGDRVGAAALSCDGFADEARSEARSGKDPAIEFRLGPLHGGGPDHAVAAVTEVLHFPGATQQRRVDVAVERSAGRWLVCGRV